MNKLSASDGAHSPGNEPASEAGAVIRFPGWQARLGEKALEEGVKAEWRRGILAAARPAKHREEEMAPWERGLYRAMRVGQYRERTWETYRQWAGRFVRWLEERGARALRAAKIKTMKK